MSGPDLPPWIIGAAFKQRRDDNADRDDLLDADDLVVYLLSIEAINNSLTTLSRSTSTTRDVDMGSRSGVSQISDQNMKIYMLLVAMGALGLPVLLHFVK